MPSSRVASRDSDEGRPAAAVHRWILSTSAVLVGFLAGSFRLLAEGRITNDHYMHLAWAQQIRLGAIPGRDFIDPGMPLMYSLSAVTQWAWPGPFSEVVLTCVMMGLAAGLIYWLVSTVTNSMLLGLAAALTGVILQPRLYSYPKILMPAVVLCALWHYASVPSARRVWALGGATVLAALLRYDLGVFALLSVLGGIAVTPQVAFSERLRRGAAYVLVTLVLVSPYLLAVQWTEGLSAHLHNGAEFSKSDAHQFLLRWMQLPTLSGWPSTDQDAAGLLYYTGLALVPITVALLVLRRRALDPPARVTLTAAVISLACYSVWIVRHPLVARVPDNAALLGIVAAGAVAMTAAMIRRDLSTRILRPALTAAATAVVVAGPTCSVLELGKMDDAIEKTRILDGVGKMRERIDGLQSASVTWPWTWYWPNGEMPIAVRYLNECLQPEQRVLLTWSAPEYYYFSRRGFAGGVALFLPPRAFTSDSDQQRMRHRMEQEAVPIVLINETSREEFATAYPQVDAFLRRRYVARGSFAIRDGSTITVAVRSDLTALRSFGDDGWPCGFPSTVL